MAHCLGHYFQHEQERGADVFAASLLSGIEQDRAWMDEELRAVRRTEGDL